MSGWSKTSEESIHKGEDKMIRDIHDLQIFENKSDRFEKYYEDQIDAAVRSYVNYLKAKYKKGNNEKTC